VPDLRTHRGPHPEDAALFAPDRHARLREAVAHVSWLLTRDYAVPSALKLVGDRFALDARQRTAVMRCACSDSARDARRAREVAPPDVRGRALSIDGYNVLTTAEAALGGGVILVGRDGAVRDMASIHGSYRKVEETRPAIHLIGRTLASLGARAARWYLDSPVSNSGRLKTILREIATAEGWDWQIEIVPDPDAVLSRTSELVATADSAILDRCTAWFNLAGHVVGAAPRPWVVNLGEPAPGAGHGAKKNLLAPDFSCPPSSRD
jgi:hypothetical protein